MTLTFARQRIALPVEAAEILNAGGSSDAVTALSTWPETEQTVEAEVGSRGYAIVSGLTQGHGAEKAFATLSALFGELAPQDKKGTLVRHVRDRGTAIGEGKSARYSDSRHGGSLHTDGAEAPMPVPEWFALHCVRQAPVGGALQLIDIRAAEERLTERPEHLAVLRSPFHFDRRGDQEPGEPPTAEKPVLFSRGGQICITYLREYIERGHEHAEVPDLTTAQIDALDFLDSVLASPDLVTEDLMAVGDSLIIDNLRFLHGRTTFVDDPDPRRARLLLRTWIHRT
jgi:alpha-ketoglutarate-dependent taurine dioxygenase